MLTLIRFLFSPSECPAFTDFVMLFSQAIEAKNLVGRYDTSLYLKAQVDNLTGHNEELRSELRAARFDATKASVELDKTKVKVIASVFVFRLLCLGLSFCC